MACTKRRLVFWISLALIIFIILVGIGGFSYYTCYKYNMANHVHLLRFAKSNHEVRVIWRREDWECWTEIYNNGKFLRHGVNLGRWFLSQKQANGVVLTSDSGSFLWITIDKDSADLSSIALVYDGDGDGDVWRTCTQLYSNNLQWYGGPQDPNQVYPSQKLIYQNVSFVTTQMRRVVERLWIASDGFFIISGYNSELFAHNSIQSNGLLTDHLCLHNKEIRFGIGSNARKTHWNVVKYYLGKPRRVPNEKMIRNVIWNTKVRFPNGINDTVIRNYANEIIVNEFGPSILDFDGEWESCTGSLTVDLEKFPDMRSLIDTLRFKKFSVRFSVHPFIEPSCEPFFSEAVNNNFTVRSNSTVTQPAHIDFTNPEAIAWFRNRLEFLQTSYGIDSFKFDGGESSFLPTDAILHIGKYSSPNFITQSYVTFASSFGNMTNVRTAWASQNVSVMLRISEFDSQWDNLEKLIPRLLLLNMNGYGFLQSDMIGGNQIHNDKELFIRWLQASVFMPSIQFSLAPWDFDKETITISRSLVELHGKYANLTLERLNLNVANGDPVNPPIWWLDPYDSIAQYIDDEFLIGETILAAPVLKKGANARDIYLPVGEWKDGNNGNYIRGPQLIRNYSAPLDIIPYFIKVT